MKKGFTLIELLVVVLIIGILAAVALPQYEKAVMKARLSTIMPLIVALRNGQEAYYMANGKFTQDYHELDIDFPPGGVVKKDPDDDFMITYGPGKYAFMTGDIVYGQLNSANSEFGFDLQYQLMPNPHTDGWIKGREAKCVARSSNKTAVSICKSLCYDGFRSSGGGGYGYPIQFCNVKPG